MGRQARLVAPQFSQLSQLALTSEIDATDAFPLGMDYETDNPSFTGAKACWQMEESLLCQWGFVTTAGCYSGLHQDTAGTWRHLMVATEMTIWLVGTSLVSQVHYRYDVVLMQPGYVLYTGRGSVYATCIRAKWFRTSARMVAAGIEHAPCVVKPYPTVCIGRHAYRWQNMWNAPNL